MLGHLPFSVRVGGGHNAGLWGADPSLDWGRVAPEMRGEGSWLASPSAARSWLPAPGSCSSHLQGPAIVEVPHVGGLSRKYPVLSASIFSCYTAGYCPDSPALSGGIMGRQSQAQAPWALVLAAGEARGDPERKAGSWSTAGTGAGRGRAAETGWGSSAAPTEDLPT